MAIFNGESFVRYAIDSLLGQTIKNIELIFIDDGSTDNTRSILLEYAGADDRIVVLHQSNVGSTKSFIRAIDLSKGKYIARHDADDVSDLYRFEAQLEWFEVSERRVLCSTNEVIVNDKKRYEYANSFPLSDLQIKRHLPWHNVFSHSSAMFKKASYHEVGGYRTFFRYSQDYDLWCRLSMVGEVGNIKERLIKVHIREEGITEANANKQVHLGAIAATLHYACIRYGHSLELDNQTNMLVFHKDKQRNSRLIKHYKAVYNVGAIVRNIDVPGTPLDLISHVLYVNIIQLRLNLIGYIVLRRYIYNLKKLTAYCRKSWKYRL